MFVFSLWYVRTHTRTGPPSCGLVVTVLSSMLRFLNEWTWSVHRQPRVRMFWIQALHLRSLAWRTYHMGEGSVVLGVPGVSLCFLVASERCCRRDQNVRGVRPRMGGRRGGRVPRKV